MNKLNRALLPRDVFALPSPDEMARLIPGLPVFGITGTDDVLVQVNSRWFGKSPRDWLWVFYSVPANMLVETESWALSAHLTPRTTTSEIERAHGALREFVETMYEWRRMGAVREVGPARQEAKIFQ